MSRSEEARLRGTEGFTAQDVGRMLGLEPALVRSLARAGLGEIARGARGELRFGFRDLVILRAARNLLVARIPAARVREVLRRLREQLPAGEPASGARITAEDGRVAIRLGGRTWDPESGQSRLDFDDAPAVPPAARIGPAEAMETPVFEADEWYELAMRLEPFAPDESREAFRRCLELRPRHVAAHAQLGRLLQSFGENRAAVEHLVIAHDASPRDPEILFHLGAALEAMERVEEAMDAWRETVRLDDRHAEAYLSLAIAADRSGDREAALRYLSAYHRLT